MEYSHIFNFCCQKLPWHSDKTILFSPQDFFLATGNPNATARKKYCAKKKTILAPRKIFVNHSVKKIYFSLRKHFCGCTIFKTIHFRYYLTVMSCVIRVCGECSLLIKRRNAREDLSTTAIVLIEKLTLLAIFIFGSLLTVIGCFIKRHFSFTNSILF